MGLDRTQTQRKEREKEMGFKHVVIQALRLIETTGGMTPERLAFELDKSLTYTKYSIIPALEQLSPCIRYDKSKNMIKWTCDEDDLEEAKQILEARPIEG